VLFLPFCLDQKTPQNRLRNSNVGANQVTS
jgi:hypothetical protein